MNSLDGVDYDAIKAAISRCLNGPYIDVVDRASPVPLHLIHFDQENRPERSPLIYAHRNGHGSMIVGLKDGGFRLCKYWRDPEKVNEYPTAFERADPVELYGMVTVGDSESLQMLPRYAWPGNKRVVSYREHLLDLHTERGADKFRVSYSDGGPRTMSPLFEGKPWQSEDVVEWCHKMVPSARAEGELARVNLSASSAVYGDLEDHPLAFMF